MSIGSASNDRFGLNDQEAEMTVGEVVMIETFSCAPRIVAERFVGCEGGAVNSLGAARALTAPWSRAHGRRLDGRGVWVE